MRPRSDGPTGAPRAVTVADFGAGGTADACALDILRPGRLPYADGLALQDRLVERRRAGSAPDTLVLLEHDPVVTLGRAADPAHVLLDRARLASRGIALFETGRGGDVTLHAPGQVVGYPILALAGAARDTHRYLRDLEDVMIRVARDFGVESERVEGLTGTWAGAEKLGAIGVRIHSGWITSHGFAFNAANDLSLYDVIVPCGIRGKGVTSLARLLGRPVDVEEVMDRFEVRFREVFENTASGRIEGGSARTALPDRVERVVFAFPEDRAQEREDDPPGAKGAKRRQARLVGEAIKRPRASRAREGRA